ncbi:MAG: GTPase domain-containing protein [Gemmataceae bacterium]
MNRWRFAVLVALFVLPLAFMAAVGGYALYQTGWARYTWWPIAGCFSIAYLLGWYWHRRRRLMPEPDVARSHWTERDRAAWALVQNRASRIKSVPVQRLAEPETYLATAREMADELARHYDPKASDPFSRVTIPELLTVLELATRDLSELVDAYVPGGHLLTVGDWRRASQAVDWYQRGRAAYWIVSALFDPLATGLRYTASQIGIGQPMDALRQDIVDWLYVAYLHRTGAYLIDLYSGRLRVGAAKYRALTEAQPLKPVRLVLFGQVKAGKSSLINALTQSTLSLGSPPAKVDVLPATDTVGRYRARSPDGSGELIILDTVGYAHEGPRADDWKATIAAAREADVLILVLHGRTAARAADVTTLAHLSKYFASRPDLKHPPVIAVLTHVDLLSPALEWSPPYDWQHGTRAKEKAMAEAVSAAREALGNGIDAVIPVCTASGRVWNVMEGLLPVLVARMDDARGTAFVRALGSETGGAGKVLAQLRAIGVSLLERLTQ